MLYPPNQSDAVKDALVRYQNNTDVKDSAAEVLKLCFEPSTLDALSVFDRTELTPDS